MRHDHRSFQLGFFVAVLAVTLVPGESRAGKFNDVLEIGAPAPAWSGLVGTDLREHSLADLKKAKAVVVVFTCNGCPVAVAYEDRIAKFAQEYRSKGVALVAINVNNKKGDRLEAMVERAKKKGFDFPYLYDPSQKIARAYGAAVTPHFFLLDGERKIAYMGAFDDNQSPDKVTKEYLRDATRAVLASEAPAESETRQFGCGIKYEKKPSYSSEQLAELVAFLRERDGAAPAGAKQAQVAGDEKAKQKKKEKKPKKEKLPLGKKMPRIVALDDAGKIWRSKDHAGKILVVYFYPADMTGGCTKQACGFRDGMDALRKSGVEVVGVSGDSVYNHQVFKRAHDLNFTLLADFDGRIARSFGVPFGKGGELVRNVGGEEHVLVRGGSAARWTFVFGPDGKLAYKNTEVKAAEDPAKVAEVIAELRRQSGA